MKVLVTGGEGFIGRHVVDRLLLDGHKVLSFDHFHPSRPLHPLRPEVEHIVGDIRDIVGVGEAMNLCDSWIHLAGVLGTAETVADPRPAADTNIHGALNVFDAARRQGNKPGVNIAVGNHWMNNPYSITKSTAERFALMYNWEHHTKIAVVRALNAYGPGQKAAPIRKLVPNLILPILRNEPVQLYGDGQQVMDMIFVEDVAAILCRALYYAADMLPSAPGSWDVTLGLHVFEAGSGDPTTVNDVALAAINAVMDGAAEPHQYDSIAAAEKAGHIVYQPMRPGEQRGAVVLGKPDTLAALGWHHERDGTSLTVGMRKSVAFYREELRAGRLS